ncbi:NUDIX domain-containing protein [Novosphingobium sp. 2638]|uniref:8-oxo-dGTP diphosphatase n=2 Tax=Novosphingobium beihaiensis TaxID=2930389 RepID=A0ABT0BT78_9SPHN|nr:NUDIX domain-containing protein [Novosphingobium beihaiensis]
MQQRRFAAVHGGLWEFPGGKLEPGERPETAAVRELEEELGVRIDAAALETVGFASGITAASKDNTESAQRPLVILLYACRTWQGVPDARDAEAIAWVRPDAIASLEMPPLDYPLAEALNRYLGAYSRP